MMRVLLVTQWFDPEPTFKGMAFAQELVRRGHEVEVLTGFPNYPGGKVYPGYRIRAYQREQHGRVHVLRVALYPSHDQSALRRIGNYVSFAITAAFAAAFLTRRADVAYVYHPPATVGLAAAVLRWLRCTPVVLDVQDLWPDTLAATGMLRSRGILALVGVWCRMLYAVVSRIVVLSPGFRRRLISRGVPAAKIDVIYNWCDEGALSSGNEPLPDAERAALHGRANIVFAGNLGAAQGLDTVLNAARLVAGTHPEVQFVLVGSGIALEGLKRRVQSEKIPSVLFLPRRPQAHMPAIYDQATALLVHLQDDELFTITIPSKTQAYLAIGKPIIMAVRGDAAELVQRAGAGVCCEPQNPTALASAVTQLVAIPAAERAALGQNGARYYTETLGLRAGVDAFERLFQASARTEEQFERITP